MHLLASLIFIFIASFFFAKVEISVEGAHGWAEKLPTWKLSKDNVLNKIFFGGTPATGYHVWMNSFILFLFHITYLFQPVSWSTELRLISLFMLFSITADFLWFVLNPAFGLKNFKKDKIWWHRNSWWGIAPRGYFIFLAISVVLYILSFHFA